MKLKFNMLTPMVIALSLVGFVQASEKHVDNGSVTKVRSVSSTEKISYDVISYDAGGSKKAWLASKVGLPVTVGTTSVKHGGCKFESGPISTTVNLDVAVTPERTITLVPMQQYPNGVLTLIDVTATSALPDEKSDVLQWEAGGKQHECVANQGNYSTHRTIREMVLEYGKAAQVKLSDQSIFEITASVGWPGPKEAP